MSSELAREIALHLPFLRRYARALSGDQRSGDDLVAACLKRLLADEALIDRVAVRLSLYHALTAICSRAAASAKAAAAEGGGVVENAAIVAQAVTSLAEPRRQILLLATLEGFSLSQVAAIMGLSEEEVRHELGRAKQDLLRQPATSILIIEDEPVIALDIARSIEAYGHRVTGIATTHRDAVELAGADPPGLVLADVQLSDDSSGIDAVAEILDHYQVPVIFITAFPERLLTGERPEPAFLITKPHDPKTLSVAISQAVATGSWSAVRP
jgi:DNA-directed RNA polymerase specialized sigma24 family protein/CheY-like chemotaxis protein